MKVLIKYIDFHWDNYQGGSGETVKATLVVGVPDTLRVEQVWDYLHDHGTRMIKERRPFTQDNKHSIVSMEIL